MQLPITGPTYEHPSQDVNYQRCINYYPSLAGPIADPQLALMPTPGLKLLVDGSGDQVRALIDFDDDHVYAVVDDKFYKVDINYDAVSATVTQLGTIDSTSGDLDWAKNASQIMLVDPTTSKAYIHTVSTETLTEVTDADFVGGDTVVFLDGYFIFNVPNSGLVYSTASNDGTSVDALDVITAEAYPDNVVGLAVDKRELWIFCEDSVEIWYDAANPNAFPLSRREGALVDQGCAAAKSILNFDNTLVWLDDRGFVVQAQNYSPVVISTPAIASAIQSYKRIDDARAYQHTENGHLFYVITFPTARKTWAYEATTQQWHERAYLNASGDMVEHLAHNHIKHKRWNVVGAHNTGKIYRMSSEYKDDAGEAIRRIRTTQHNRLEYNQYGIACLELHMETGKGAVTGTGSDPQMFLRYSNDGGYTWSNSLPRSMGPLGTYDTRIRWNRLGTGREWLFEFTTEEPVAHSIIDASIDVEGGSGA